MSKQAKHTNELYVRRHAEIWRNGSIVALAVGDESSANELIGAANLSRQLAEQRAELLEAIVAAQGVLQTALQYFPKSIRNGDRFHLLNILENTVNPASAKAKAG